MHPKVTGYAFINHPIPDLFKKLANDYIEKEYGTWIYRHKSNYYDIKTLNNLVNLDCMNCHLAHTRLCCEGSTPYPILENEREKIMAKSDEIFANTLTKEEYEKVSSIMEYHNAKPIIDDEGNFATPCNSCIFFNKFDNGSYGCSIHRHALNQKIPYTALKPSACLMYPLDVLTLDNGGYFLLGIDVGTVVDIYPYKKKEEIVYGVKENNKGFSRWNQFDLKHLCVNEEQRNKLYSGNSDDPFYKRDIPNDIYNKSDYKPLYQEEKNVICYLFSEEDFDFINKKTSELSDQIIN